MTSLCYYVIVMNKRIVKTIFDLASAGKSGTSMSLI